MSWWVHCLELDPRIEGMMILCPLTSSTAVLFYVKLDEHLIYPSHPRLLLCSVSMTHFSLTIVDDSRGVGFQNNIKYPTDKSKNDLESVPSTNQGFTLECWCVRAYHLWVILHVCGFAHQHLHGLLSHLQSCNVPRDLFFCHCIYVLYSCNKSINSSKREKCVFLLFVFFLSFIPSNLPPRTLNTDILKCWNDEKSV